MLSVQLSRVYKSTISYENRSIISFSVATLKTDPGIKEALICKIFLEVCPWSPIGGIQHLPKKTAVSSLLYLKFPSIFAARLPMSVAIDKLFKSFSVNGSQLSCWFYGACTLSVLGIVWEYYSPEKKKENRKRKLWNFVTITCITVLQLCRQEKPLAALSLGRWIRS